MALFYPLNNADKPPLRRSSVNTSGYASTGHLSRFCKRRGSRIEHSSRHLTNTPWKQSSAPYLSHNPCSHFLASNRRILSWSSIIEEYSSSVVFSSVSRQLWSQLSPINCSWYLHICIVENIYIYRTEKLTLSFSRKTKVDDFQSISTRTKRGLRLLETRREGGVGKAISSGREQFPLWSFINVRGEKWKELAGRKENSSRDGCSNSLRPLGEGGVNGAYKRPLMARIAFVVFN